MKVMTIVTGKVPAEKSSEFEKAYASVKESALPPGLENSFLLRSTSDPQAYTIQSIWSSREALEGMRSREKPKAVALFEQVGVSPKVEIHEVAVSVP
ncbi:MAG TPA: antibiotic biosynthesis monooxygenase [Nitrososphaerales archaeon]|nr:antibiotic biosynthesis monooxygenase [Nitrososphaerales archaeon]